MAKSLRCVQNRSEPEEGRGAKGRWIKIVNKHAKEEVENTI